MDTGASVGIIGGADGPTAIFVTYKLGWFNDVGLLFVILLLVPNLLFALRHREGFVNRFENKWLERLEQVGRFGCMAFMVFNLPGTVWGFASGGSALWYLGLNLLLLALYWLAWAVFWRKSGLFRALTLSILPSVQFLASGILMRSLLLTACALVFAPCHILISYRNAKA